MSRRVLISPSLLSCDFSRLAEEVRAVEAAGADWIHVDVMDGRFVPNITIGPVVVQAIKRVATRPLDTHLMIVEPERYLEAFAKAGSDLLTVHVEVSPHLHRTLQHIRQVGARPSVVLNPSTPLSAVEEVLGEVDMVLLMSVNPGFGGQSFIDSTLRKAELVRKLIDSSGRDIRLEVDGGIKVDNIRRVADAGADTFVAGSAIFGQKDYRKVIDAMRAELARR
jgi:ribulose-phosphate 3-epimerase